MVCCVYCSGMLNAYRTENIKFLPNTCMLNSELKSLIPLIKHGKCQSCGSIIATDCRISHEEKLLEIYRKLPAEYWKDSEYKNCTKFYKKIEKLLNHRQSKMTICDVGCGNGSFLNTLEDYWQKFGVEPGQINSTLLEKRGIKYFNGTLKQSMFQKHSMDVVTYLDVFEHLVNPVQEIKIAKEFLSPNGKLVILTADANSITARLSGKAWIYIRHIGHITIASQKSLVNALKSYGFSKIEVIKQSHPASADFIKWLVYLTASKILGSKENIIGNKGNIPIFHDHMLIIASL